MQKQIAIFDHHIVRKSKICSLNKLTSKELHLILVDANTVTPTAQDYLKNLFETSQFNWEKKILICNTTLNTKAHVCSVNYTAKRLCTFFMTAYLLKEYRIT